jgi:hypothetical protein
MEELVVLSMQEEENTKRNDDSDDAQHQVAQEKVMLRKKYLETEIAKLDADIRSLYSTATGKYLEMEASIGATHLVDAVKLKKAASSFTRIKVNIEIDHRFSIKVQTRSLR